MAQVHKIDQQLDAVVTLLSAQSFIAKAERLRTNTGPEYIMRQPKPYAVVFGPTLQAAVRYELQNDMQLAIVPVTIDIYDKGMDECTGAMWTLLGQVEEAIVAAANARTLTGAWWLDQATPYYTGLQDVFGGIMRFYCNLCYTEGSPLVTV